MWTTFCMHLHKYKYACGRLYKCMWTTFCMHLHKYKYAWGRLFACIYTNTNMHVDDYINACGQLFACIYTNTNMHGDDYINACGRLSASLTTQHTASASREYITACAEGGRTRGTWRCYDEILGCCGGYTYTFILFLLYSINSSSVANEQTRMRARTGIFGKDC